MLGGNGAQSSKHCAVDASCIVEERANYLLSILLVLFGERWGCVNGFRILFGCTIHGFDVGILLVLRLCWWHELESDDVFVDVVPVNIHSEIACTVPVLGAFVVFIQDDGEVLDVFTANVFDAKVVNTECEGDWVKIVLP